MEHAPQDKLRSFNTSLVQLTYCQVSCRRFVDEKDRLRDFSEHLGASPNPKTNVLKVSTGHSWVSNHRQCFRVELKAKYKKLYCVILHGAITIFFQIYLTCYVFSHCLCTAYPPKDLSDLVAGRFVMQLQRLDKSCVL